MVEDSWSQRLRVPEDLKEGESWYLVSSSWVKRLLVSSENPGPVDNSDLLDESGALKTRLQASKDFIPVNTVTWNDLLETFKLKDAQDPIPRKVIGNQLSLYPFDLSHLQEKLNAVKNKKLIVGDLWYLVDFRWYSALQNYLSETLDENRPGPIDNSNLLTSSGELKTDILERINFEYLDKPTWDELVEQFSLFSDQDPIERKVVMNGKTESDAVIDLYPINVFLLNSKKEKMEIQLSKYDSPDTIIEKVRKALDLESGLEIKIKVELSQDVVEYVHKGVDSLNGTSLESGCLLSVDKNNENGGEWMTTTSRSNNAKPVKIRNKNTSVEILSSNSDDKKEESTYSSFSTRYNMGSYSEGSEDENARPGICGLSNLGNTCFMNSIIQGLSNTPPITEYFANDNYIEDINKTNPLGMKGEIAKTFGEMIKLMWSGRYKYISPRSFKSAVGRFAPQFSGYQQQDSQELLTFLLDGLHEDLNRVKKKPYIEIKDSGDRPDEEVALEAWEVYKKRNDSVILDVFHGLLKSTLICPVCPKVSVTFDPFCYLSLPLPDHREKQFKIRVVWYDKSRPHTLFKLTVPKAGSVSDLQKGLSKETGVPEGYFKVTEIFSNKISKEYKPEHPLSSIHDDTFAYELPPLGQDQVYASVSFKEERLRGSSGFFAPPFILRVEKGMAGEALYEEILSHIGALLRKEEERPGKEEDEESAPSSSNNNNTSPDNNLSEESSSLASEDVKMNLGEDEDEEEPPVLLSNGKPPIFKLCIMTINGSIVDRYIELSEENLFSEKSLHIGLEWTSENKRVLFNEGFASKVEQDPSLTRIHTKAPINLSDCLELYTTNEKLGKDDAWYCPSCEEHQQATKKFDLWSLPSILVISLKRFSYTRSWRDKLDTLVDFPLEALDMSPYIINPKHDPAVYDLIAVSNHYGVMGGGHYTAMAQNKNDGQWYNFDDASVYPKKDKDVVTNAAYVLFYRRRESRSKASSTVTTASGLTNGVLNNGHNSKSAVHSSSLNSSSLSGEEEEKMDVN